MSDEKKVGGGGTLWNTPAGPTPPALAQLIMSRRLVELTPDEIAKLRERVEKKLDNDPTYQAFKRGAERARALRDPTASWNRPWRPQRSR